MRNDLNLFIRQFQSIIFTKFYERIDKMSNKFLYFAYGSNMLMKRIHINNPTAIRKDIGFLKVNINSLKKFLVINL